MSKSSGQPLEAIFREINQKYFNGRLPEFSVRTDFRASGDVDGWCYPETQTIHLRHGLAPADKRRVLLHEMIHIKTGGSHDRRFLHELRRIARKGEPAAQEELEFWETGRRIVQTMLKLALLSPQLDWRELMPQAEQCLGLKQGELFEIAPWVVWVWRRRNEPAAKTILYSAGKILKKTRNKRGRISL